MPALHRILSISRPTFHETQGVLRVVLNTPALL